MRLFLVLSLIIIFKFPSYSYTGEKQKENSENEISKIERPFSSSFFYVNDNYIATWWPNYDDQYFGADDFLTVSLLSRVYWSRWKLSTNYTSVTLRKLNTRYDLLSSSLSKVYTYKNYNYSVGGGFLYKGNLGGAKLQNEVHRLGNVYPVHMPYSSQSGLEIIIEVTGKANYQPKIAEQDLFRPFIETRIFSDYVPSRITAGLSYQWQFSSILTMEILTAYRTMYNSVKEYSPMIRPGFLNALNLKINVYENIFIDIGFAQLPTRNILTDELFDPYKNDYLPQAWLSLSWYSKWTSLIDHLDY